MGLAIVEEAGLAVPLLDLKAYLRIESGSEDALLTRALRAATDLCERFIGQWLIVRAGEDVLPVQTGVWQRLDVRPVVAIDSVTGIAADGAAFALPVASYAIDIDRHDDGWVRIVTPDTPSSGTAARVRVRYRAGMAQGAAEIPPGIAQGIVRMAAEIYASRESDGRESNGVSPPAAVTVLWRPWRRMRLR